MFKLAVTAALLVVAKGQGCEVCGEGREVGNLEAIFEWPDQPAVPCGVLEQAGRDGVIPLVHCPILPGLIDVCECTPTEVAAPAAPASSFPPCHVCGEGSTVSSGSNTVAFEGTDNPVMCDVAESAALNGGISPESCTAGLRKLFDLQCGCTDTAEDAPVNTPANPPANPSTNPPTTNPLIIPPTTSPDDAEPPISPPSIASVPTDPLTTAPDDAGTPSPPPTTPGGTDNTDLATDPPTRPPIDMLDPPTSIDMPGPPTSGASATWTVALFTALLALPVILSMD